MKEAKVLDNEDFKPVVDAFRMLRKWRDESADMPSELDEVELPPMQAAAIH